MKNPRLRSPARHIETQIRATGTEDSPIRHDETRFQSASRGIVRANEVLRTLQEPQPLFRCWPEIRARIRAARQLAVFLDFDGTLVNLRRRPSDVRVPRQIKQVLERLAQHSNVFVAIVSGRRLRDIQTMLGAQGVHTFGLHGAEREGRRTALSKTTRLALARAKRQVWARLGILPDIWLEDKILSLAVHYRGASAVIVRQAHATLLEILEPLCRNLSSINGEKVWEILPREIAGKGATIQGLLAAQVAGTLAIYVGDDAADELAFAVIPDQITVQVGKKRNTHARFLLQNPAEVLRFLTRLERELP